MRVRLIAVFIATFLLSSCGQTVGVADIDFNADIEAIGIGVAKFQENTRKSGTVNTFEDFVAISENNGLILSEIEASTDNFLSNIEQASSQLPEVDTIESPSKSKLVAWAEGYKSWIYYQKQNQVIGEACMRRASDWMSCLIENLSTTSQNESSSTIKLTAAIQGIQEWRKLAGQ